MPLNENVDARAATLSPGTCVSAVMMSSVMPSLKYSLSGSALMFANGSTATDASGLEGETAGVSSDRNASTSTAPVACRSPGVFSSSRDTARLIANGTDARRSVTGGGVYTKRFATTACAVDPVNGSSPVSISYSTQPSENKSLRPSRSSPDACSGLMYAGVPTVTPICVNVDTSDDAAARALPMPKSATTACPSCSSMFSGLMSRCTTSCRCA